LVDVLGVDRRLERLRPVTQDPLGRRCQPSSDAAAAASTPHTEECPIPAMNVASTVALLAQALGRHRHGDWRAYEFPFE
jgi:hypothetical protein